MSLSSQHVKSAQFANLFTLCLTRLRDVSKNLIPLFFVFLRGVSGAQAPLRHGLNSHELGVTAEHDVCSTTSHVCGDGDGANATGLGDDDRFPGVVLGVQNFMANTALREHLGQALTLLHTCRSHQHGLAFFMPPENVLHHLANFRRLVAINQVGLVLTDHRLIGGDGDNTERIGRHEFAGFCFSGSCHARKLLIQAEIVLQGDGCQGLVLRLDGNTLFGFNRLVNTFVVSATGKNTTGVFVNNQHLAVDDHIVFIFFEQRFCFDGVIQKRDQRSVG